MRGTIGWIAGLLCLVSLLMSGPARAQDDLDQMFQDMEGAFKELENQLDALDREFTHTLARQWKELEDKVGLKNFDAPKPIRIPAAPTAMPPAPTPDQEQVLVSPQVIAAPAPASTAVKPLGGKGQDLAFDFYRQSILIKHDARIRSVKPAGKINNQAIAGYWAILGGYGGQPLVDQFLHYQKQLALNDWGYFMLAHQAGEALHQNPALANLFTWFILTKSGYQTRVGYTDKDVILFGACQTTVYGSPFVTLGGSRFFALSTKGTSTRFGNLFTYDGEYPKTGRPIDLGFQKYPNLKPAPLDKNLAFDFRGKNNQVAVRLDRTLVDFMKFYPQTDFQVYFEAAASPYGGASLLKSLGPLVQGRSEVEAVRTLLRFSQKAFQYKTDQESFGREKVLLPEETMAYPYSDCEDRSILFSFLVRNLTGLQVVGLDYPEHIATAVLFKGKVSGDGVNHAGTRYTVCDPTYINADIGQAMPQYRTAPVKVIDING